MNEPVYTKYHKSNMTFEEFKDCVHNDIKLGCYDEPYPYFNETYWATDEWQQDLKDEYDRYSKSCKNETDWDLAVNAVMFEFSLLRTNLKDIEKNKYK